MPPKKKQIADPYWDEASINKLDSTNDAGSPLVPETYCPFQAAAAPAAPAQPERDGSLKILLWNIENLGGAYGRQAVRSEQHIVEIAQLLRNQDADVAVILEVRERTGNAGQPGASAIEGLVNEFADITWNTFERGTQTASSNAQFAARMEHFYAPAIRRVVGQAFMQPSATASQRKGSYDPDVGKKFFDTALKSFVLATNYFASTNSKMAPNRVEDFTGAITSWSEFLFRNCTPVLKRMFRDMDAARIPLVLKMIFTNAREGDRSFDSAAIESSLASHRLEPLLLARVMRLIPILQSIYYARLFVGDEEEDAEPGNAEHPATAPQASNALAAPSPSGLAATVAAAASPHGSAAAASASGAGAEAKTHPGLRELKRIVDHMGPGYSCWPPLPPSDQVPQGIYSGGETVGLIFKSDRVQFLGHRLVALEPSNGRMPHLFRMKLIREQMIFRIVGWHAPADSKNNFCLRADHFPAFAQWCAGRKPYDSPVFLASDLNIATERLYRRGEFRDEDPAAFPASGPDDMDVSASPAAAASSASAAAVIHNPRKRRAEETTQALARVPGQPLGASSIAAGATGASAAPVTAGLDVPRTISNADEVSLDHFMNTVTGRVDFTDSLFTHQPTSLVKKRIMVQNQATLELGLLLGRTPAHEFDDSETADERSFRPHQLIADYMEEPAMFGHRFHAFDKIMVIRGRNEHIGDFSESIIDHSSIRDFAAFAAKAGLYPEERQDSLLGSIEIGKYASIRVDDPDLEEALLEDFQQAIDPMRRLSDHLPISVTYALHPRYRYRGPAPGRG